jgi:hypothetical protein
MDTKFQTDLNHRSYLLLVQGPSYRQGKQSFLSKEVEHFKYFINYILFTENHNS